MKAVVLGAASGMGRAIARQLAERGESVFVMGIGDDDLKKSAADLEARHPKKENPGYAICDLEKPDTFAPALDAADKALGDFDTVIVTAALFASQEALEKAWDLYANNTVARAGFMLGIIGLIAFPLAPVALLCSIIGLRRVDVP